MEGHSSLKNHAKCSQGILCSSWRFFRSPMPNENPSTLTEVFLE